MKRILFLITFFAFGLITYGQKITALGESTTATGTSLMFVREGATGDLIKRITKDNMLKDYAKLNSPAFLTQITIGGITITPTLASYLDFTSSGQTQINLKAPSANAIFTGAFTMPTPFTLGAVSVITNGTRLNYLTSATGTTGDPTSNLVFSDSPTLLTPALGTPSAIVLTNATGTAAGMTAGTVTGFTPAGGSLTLAGADALTLTTTGVTDVTFPTTGTLATTSQLYTNLTSFVDQTAWRVFYSNTDGDVTELALGASGTYLGSNGAAVAPTFSVPSGAGDVLKVGTPVDNQVGIWTGDGTLEGDADLTFDGTTLTGAFLGNLTGSAATLTTTRAIYGNNFDGSAALTQVITSTYGGTGNGFTKFTGPTTAEKTFTLPDASATLLYSGGTLGTPSGGTLTNCAFPTLNQNTTGSAATLTTARTIGGVSFNGSANVTVASATGGFTVSGAVLETATLKATTGAAAGNMLISDADGDLSYLGAGATTEILVGGGAAVPVWTTATGTGAPVRGTSPTIGGTLAMDNGATIINTDADNLDITEDTVKVSGLIRAASAKIDDAIFFETAIGAIFYVADNSVGSNDTYTATYVGFTYTTGKVITFHPLTANIDGCTLNINGDGAVAIETQAAGALSTNDLLATGFYHLCWDGDNWVLMD